MTDTSTGPASSGPTPLTVQQMHDQLARIRSQLTTAAAVAGELDRWSDALPLRHVPNGEQVLMTDLIPETVPDREALIQHVQRAEDLAGVVAEALHQIRDDVAAQTGTFAGVGGFGATDGTIQVSLACGGRDDDVFDAQRHAARRTGLTFHDPGRIWRGQLPLALHEAPAQWQAVLDAIHAGAGAWIQP